MRIEGVSLHRNTPDSSDPGEADDATVVPIRSTVAAVTNRLAMSERLRQRRYELVPVDVPHTDVQGREPGESTSPEDLVELISSIATVGLLQPLLLEDTPDGFQVVAGERRLRAMRWGRVHLADNPNFTAAPAVICPGPLSEEERRVWQLIENLARTDLQPGELAAALMFERCAVMATVLAEHDHPVDDTVWSIEDPQRRWDAINKHRLRAELHTVGAPWDHVIGRLGLQLSADRARQLVRAFKALPAEMSAEMDEHDVQLASRLAYLRLDRGRRAAAEAIWDALKTRDKTSMLTATVTLAETNPDIDVNDVDDLVDEAERRRAEAIEARNDHQRNGHDDRDNVDPSAVPDDVVTSSFRAIDELLDRLRAGEELKRFAAGSLQLRLSELGAFIGRAA